MKTLSLTMAVPALLAVLVSVGTAGPVHSASGGGTVEYAGALNTYAFTAQIDAAGEVKGQAEFQLRYVNTSIHVEVDCLAVMGNEAWIGGTITRSSNPAQVGLGLHVLFRVQDNGEGLRVQDNAAGDAHPPDMTSQLEWGAVPSCDTTPPLFLIEWTHGNVQVK